MAAPTPSILFVGESSSGKSFLINSLPYYLSHQTLDQVRSSDIKCVIRTDFTLTDNDDVVYHIQEVCVDQSSDPLACDIHQLTLDNQIVQLIECPAVTADEEKNTKICDNIVETVGGLDALLAIVFVINSNQVTLEKHFQTNFKSLLSYFHKSAVDKIMFMFTWADGSCFKPGNVRQPLSELVSSIGNLQLENNNMFCVDSKWLRYVIAEKHGAQFAQDEIESCKRAWLKSQNEVRRMWRNIGEKKPYVTRETKIIKDLETIIIASKPFLRKILRQSKLLADDLTRREDFRNENHQLIKRSVSREVANVVCTFCENRVCCYDCKIGINVLKYYCSKFEFLSGICKICGCHLEKHLKKPEVRAKVPDSAIAPYMEESMELLNEEKKKMEQEFFTIEFILNKLIKYVEYNAIVITNIEIDEEFANVDITAPDESEISVLKEKLFYLEFCGTAIKKSYDKFNKKIKSQ